MKKLRTILALIMICLLVLPLFAACDPQKQPPVNPPVDGTETPPPPGPEGPVPLVVAYDRFSAKFSPFYGDTAYDMDVDGMTQVSLMTTDRVGAIIYNGIEGETRDYNGKEYFYSGIADLSVDYDEETNITTYIAKLREDIAFSDGVPLTANDVIFTYYTFLDTDYVGSTSLSSYPIIGLGAYRTGVPDDVYSKYSPIADAILEAGPGLEGDGEGYTAEQYAKLWGMIDAAWAESIEILVNYEVATYGGAYPPAAIGLPFEEIDDTTKYAWAMALWGFDPECAEDGGEDEEGNPIAIPTYDLVDTFPTADDYIAQTKDAYDYDYADFTDTELDGVPGFVTMTDLMQRAVKDFITDSGEEFEPVDNIEGIKKLDEYTVEVKTEGYKAPAVYSILGIEVTPMHYYGNADLYDYENNMFGFPRGDLTSQKALLGQPMGAGPYKFIEYTDGVVFFESNPNYYKGAPKIEYVQFKETNSSDVVSAVNTGDADCGDIAGSKAIFEEIGQLNGDGSIQGSAIYTTRVDNLGYGYLGINADTVNVGGTAATAGTQESKYLRLGLMTVFALYRDESVNSWYGDAASVIQYPISNTSWAAPRPTDEGYRPAFSTALNGELIYTDDDDFATKEAKVKAAAVEYLEAAGYTVEDGKVVEAPEGAKLSYEAIIPGDGQGAHPAYNILTGAKAAFAEIGIELIINDPADSNLLWDTLDAGTQEFWTAAWGATIDPDMYQVYHSDNVVGKNGTDSNHYHIADPALDAKIMEARESDDQAVRKAIYKEALDILLSWAVELPTYQRQNATIFNPVKINVATITPDITTFYRWLAEIEKMEMNP
ncbi:MAG: ABC transporter substrate-binding protein [Clostridiales bacterium]|nr:ABC transporter substrate-binding protein [Clostridiales bacterium]